MRIVPLSFGATGLREKSALRHEHDVVMLNITNGADPSFTNPTSRTKSLSCRDIAPKSHVASGINNNAPSGACAKETRDTKSDKNDIKNITANLFILCTTASEIRCPEQQKYNISPNPQTDNGQNGTIGTYRRV